MTAPDHEPASAPAECPACLAASPRRLTATEARALYEERTGGPLSPAAARALDSLYGWDAPPRPVGPAPDLAAVIATAPGVSEASVQSDRRWVVLAFGGREYQVTIRDMGPARPVTG